MTFLFEKPEPSVAVGVNWPVLEYLIERFNRSDLEGSIILRRTPLLTDLELCLTARCNGKALLIVSEPFEDILLTMKSEQENLIRLVSRFLLRAKHEHAKLFTYSPQVSTESLPARVADRPLRQPSRDDSSNNRSTSDGSVDFSAP